MQVAQEFERQRPEVEELEKAEQHMWSALYRDRPLDSYLLFTQIKRLANEPDPSDEVKEQYALLQRLRVKQSELQALVSGTPSSEWDAGTLASDLEALQLNVRLTFVAALLVCRRSPVRVIPCHSEQVSVTLLGDRFIEVRSEVAE